MRAKSGKNFVKAIPPRQFQLLLIAMLSTVVVFASTRPLMADKLFQQVGIASSPNPVGSGARAIGMGGAFIAIADDATAASWNPAGLIQLERPEVSLVGEYFYRTTDFSSEEHPEISSEGAADNFNINYFSISCPFEFFRNMVFSLNFQRLYDFTQAFDYTYDYSSQGVNLKQEKHFRQEGSLGALGLACAVEITPNISIGGTLNLWTDKLWENGWEATYQEHGVGSQGNEDVTIDVLITDKYSDFNGWNANLGILWDINRYFSAGAVFKTPFTASADHEFYSLITSSLSSSTEPKQVLENVEIHMPLSYGIGLAWRLTDALSFDFDLYRTQWSEYKLTDSQGNTFNPIDGRPESESKIEDTTQLRLGGEYLVILHDKNMAVPVRAGFFYDPEPAYEKMLNFYGVAVGSGITLNRYVFDLSYQLRWSRGVDTGNLIATSTADIAQHSVLASLIAHF